ncbi:MAG: PDZ domain-containing protein [Phycisphaerales bacterium]
MMRTLNVMLALAGAAIACASDVQAQDGSRKLRWNPDQQPESGVTHQSVTRMSSNVNGEKYEVEIVNDQVHASINGEHIPQERVRRTDNGIEILDEQGEVLHRFNVTVGDQPRLLLRAPDRPSDQADEFRPKVMIGITMDETNEGVRVDSVIDGLPAAAAGIKPGDIIRELNDKSVESVAAFREQIGGLNPGETATIMVFRDGKDIELKVKVERFDDSRLGVATREREMISRIESPQDRAREEFMEDVRRSCEGLDLSAEQRKTLEERLNSSFSRLTESMNLGLMGLPEGMMFSMPQGRVWTIDPSTPGRGMTFKVPRDGEQSDQERRFDQLMRRFEAMERRIETLSRQLDEKRPSRDH